MRDDLPEIFKQEAVDLYLEAKMSRCKTLVVEGVDDVAIYNSLARQDGVRVQVLPAEVVKKDYEGCRGVISIFESLSLDASIDDYDLWLAGFIDGDVRRFRGEVPTFKGLLVLDRYSIESYFVSNEVARYLLSILTKADFRLLDAIDDHKLSGAIFEDLEMLYYISLDALKFSLHKGYESVFKYSDEWGRVRSVNKERFLSEKRLELDEFAVECGVEFCIESISCFAKGKWFLNYFVEKVKRFAEGLEGSCKDGIVAPCICCGSGVENKCQYKYLKGYQETSLIDLAKRNVSIADLNFLKRYIQNFLTRGV